MNANKKTAIITDDDGREVIPCTKKNEILSGRKKEGRLTRKLRKLGMNERKLKQHTTKV